MPRLHLPRAVVFGMKWVPTVVAVVLALALVGLPRTTSPTYVERTVTGDAWRTNGFTVAVVWPKAHAPGFVEGARLALEDLERSGSALAGRIRLRVFDEPMTPEEGGIATQVVRHGDVMAVIGHEVSEHVVPASLVYEAHSVVFITPSATDPRVTAHHFQYLFRFRPDDAQMAAALADYAMSEGLMRVGVLSARTMYGESASRQFMARATERGVQVVFSRSYHPTERVAHVLDFRPLAAEVRTYTFDALAVFDELPQAARLITDLVRMGVTQPLLSTDKLDDPRLHGLIGASIDQVRVASAFAPASTAPGLRAFATRFQTQYGQRPGYDAVQGYDALMLVAEACLAGSSAAPLTLATTIRLAAEWRGLDGSYGFTREGGITRVRIATRPALDADRQRNVMKGTGE